MGPMSLSATGLISSDSQQKHELCLKVVSLCVNTSSSTEASGDYDLPVEVYFVSLRVGMGGKGRHKEMETSYCGRQFRWKEAERMEKKKQKIDSNKKGENRFW